MCTMNLTGQVTEFPVVASVALTAVAIVLSATADAISIAV